MNNYFLVLLLPIFFSTAVQGMQFGDGEETPSEQELHELSEDEAAENIEHLQEERPSRNEVSLFDALLNGRLMAIGDVIYYNNYSKRTPISAIDADFCESMFGVREILTNQTQDRDSVESISINMDSEDILNTKIQGEMNEGDKCTIQKKRFYDFISLELPINEQNFCNLLNKCPTLAQSLEEQLGGSIFSLSNEEIIKTIKRLVENRSQFIKALESQDAKAINEACKNPLQLEPKTLDDYIIIEQIKLQEKLFQKLKK